MIINKNKSGILFDIKRWLEKKEMVIAVVGYGL